MGIKTKRWIRRSVLCVALAGLAAAGVTYYLLQRPPAVWQEARAILDESSPAQRAEAAEAVKQRLAALAGGVAERADGSAVGVGPGPERLSLDKRQGKGKQADTLADEPVDLSKVPVDQTHEVLLSNEELVAMIEQMFDEWALQRGYVVPDEVGKPVVMARGGDLVFAFEVSSGSWSQVFSGGLDLSFTPDGMAQGKVQGLTAGSLPLSVQSIGGFVKDNLPASKQDLADQLGDWLSELDGFEFKPVLELDNRRRARVLGMRISDDAVTLTMRVQDHATYKEHNALIEAGRVAVTDSLGGWAWDGSAFTGVEATSD